MELLIESIGSVLALSYSTFTASARPNFHTQKRSNCGRIATPSLKAPSGSAWVHEIKHDGYRLIARRDGNRVRLYTRRGYDWTDKYPWIVDSLLSLRVRSVIIDGEAVWAGTDGKSDFDKLHSNAHDHQVFLYAFDLLELNSEDYRPHPLEKRKAKLQN
jgi:bifunctional non-homologous end joining protein LigD